MLVNHWRALSYLLKFKLGGIGCTFVVKSVIYLSVENFQFNIFCMSREWEGQY